MGACCENTPVQPESRPMTNTPHSESADHGYISDKDRYLARLKRIEGQARGIHRMIDEETYCIDVLTQISSITSALNNVALSLLDDHVRHCVVRAAQTDGPAAEENPTEAADAIARLVRSYNRPGPFVQPPAPTAYVEQIDR